MARRALIVFVKSRFYYESFTDFWTLVELSNFETCWMDEINLRSTYIYIIPCVDFRRDKWHLSWWKKKTKRARLITWDLERPHPRGGLESTKRLLHKQNFDEVWSSDYQLSKDLDSKFVILGSDEKLGKRPFLFKNYDFISLCHINGRRGRILEQLKNVASNGWGKYRQNRLRASKFGLTIHQDSDLYTEPLRLALFAAYELPIISENCYDCFPLNDLMLNATYDNLVDFCSDCLSNYKKLRHLGKEIKQRLCYDYRFKNMVEYAARI